MKVAVINTFNAKEIIHWAGIPYHNSLFFDSLFGNKISYVVIPPLKRRVLSFLLGFYYNKIRKKKYYTWADRRFIYSNQARVSDSLKEKYDLIITYEFYLVPLLKKKYNKVIYWNDATFENLHNFYAGYSNFSGYSLKAAHAIQKKALDLSDMVVYSSDWAIDTAAAFYHTDRKKLRKILFASNLKISLKEDEVGEFIKEKDKDVIKLLFLAADWERKGGGYAVEVLNRLNERGIKALLYVVGTDVPAIYRENENIVPYGFVSKGSAGGEKKIVSLFKECSFLILPTLVDMTPVAFSEANSFALPVVTTNVGGIPSVIKNNVNGCYFEMGEFIEKAVEFIMNHLPATEQYNSLCYSSYAYYQDHMSWEQVRGKFLGIIQDLSLAIPE